MEIFIQKPSIDMFPGVRVTKDTAFEFKNENVVQKVENLVLHSTTWVKGEGYESVYDATIQLAEGDVLIFEEKGRGYIKPVDGFVTVAEAIADLTAIEGVGECTE